MKKIFISLLALGFIAISCDTKKVDEKIAHEIEDLKDEDWDKTPYEERFRRIIEVNEVGQF